MDGSQWKSEWKQGNNPVEIMSPLLSLSRREKVEFHLSRPRAANILEVGIFDVCVRIPVRICGGGGVCNVCVRVDVRIETKQ